MVIVYKNKVVNLNGLGGFTSIVNKDGKLSVYFGSVSELIGGFTFEEAERHLEKIYKSLESGEKTVIL